MELDLKSERRIYEAGIRPSAEIGLALLSGLEQAERQVARVREVHRPIDVEPSETICHACSTLRGNGETLRYFPYKEWPCDTIRALDGDGRG